MAETNFQDLACDILEASKCAFGDKVPAQYLPKAGGSFPITGIFDNHFEQVDPDTEQVIASNQVTYGIKLKDLPNPPCKGDKLIRCGKTFLVIDSQEDGVVGAILFLHEDG